MKKNVKKIRLYIVNSLTLLFTLSILINSNLLISNQDISITENDKNSNLKTSASNINGRPLLINQYSTITNSFFPASMPTNVSFTLYESWTSKNVNIFYDGVSLKKQRIYNKGFDLNSSGWLYKSNNPTEYIDQGWQSTKGNPPGSMEIKLDNGLKNKGDYGYYEQNVSIPEKLSTGLISRLSTQFFIPTLLNYPKNVSLYLAIIIGSEEINVTYDFQDFLIINTWVSLNMNFDPSIVGETEPGNLTIRVGIYTEEQTTINPFVLLGIDNIKLDLWTMPNEPNLVKVLDNEFGSNYTYINSSYGKGYSFIDVERTRESTDVIFTIFSNKSDILDFSIYNIIINSSVVRSFNSSISEVEGCICSFEDNIMWETYIEFSEYYKYGEIWAEIVKPTDWSIINLYDRDNIDKVGSCLDVGIGSNKTTIPIGIMTPSNIERPWKIVASSENYIVAANLAYWNGTEYLEASKISFGDIFQINITLNNSISFLGTTLNCTINYPNGTLYWNQSKFVSSSNIQFENLMVGFNMTVGTYQVILEWVNNQSKLYTDKAGFKSFDFKVWHHTNLTAIEQYIEILAGDPLLIKVKFIDYDINSTIGFAEVNYSSTFGQFSTMVYIGSGIYFAEINTNSLEFGDYYFSVSANKLYYENLTINNIIHLKVVPQPLALELSSSILQADANSIASCRVSAIGAISKTLLYPANISTDWFNPYNVTENVNGTYTLDFSTENIPTHGFLESYTIEIYANKTNYGEVTEYLTLMVYPIPTAASTNVSLFTVHQNDIIKLKANYTIEDMSELIGGANCTVEWSGTYQITPLLNEFEITLNTTGLVVDYYSVLITFKKAGYETAFKNIVVVINEQEVNMTVVLNSNEINENELIEAYFQQELDISVRVLTTINPIYLSGGTITLISPKYQQDLIESPSTYFNLSVILDGINFSAGINTIFLRFQQTNYTTTIFAFQLYIRAQNVELTVQVDNQDIVENTLFEFYYNQVFQLSCKAFAEIEAIYLSGGTFTFINNEQEKTIPEVSDNWFNSSILISSDFFSLGPNYVYIKFEQANYTTTTFPFQLYIRAQNIDLTVNINNQSILENELIECYYSQNIQLSCKAFAEIEAIFLSGGTMTLVNREQEIAIPEVGDYWFNSSILISSINFSLGPNNVYIKFEQTNYTTTTFAFQLYIKAQNIDLTVYVNHQDISEDPLIECYYNQLIQLSCRAYAEIEDIYLSGGTITFVNNEQEIVIPEMINHWFNGSILISSSIFSLGPNNVYIRFEQANYTTTAVAFQVLVKQIEIMIDNINFVDAIEGIEGDKVLIQLRLTEELSSNIIVNATLFYSWRFGNGDFRYDSNGTYEANVKLPTGYTGNRALQITITTNNTIYKSREYSVIITITPREIPNYVMWIIIGSLIVGIGVLGTLSLRSYVILPRKRKKEAELMDKIQVYKDVKNMQALMIIQKNSGLPIYSQRIQIFGEEDDAFLVSGFIQAITNFSEVLIRREFEEQEETKDHSEYAKNVIELDFKIFQLLVCDYGVVRLLIFLTEKSSERLKKQLYYLALALNTQFSKEFTEFTGDIKLIKDDLIYMINQFLSLHYIEKFEINRDNKYVNAVLDSKELTKIETRLFNVIKSVTTENREFNLQIPIDLIHEKDENLVLEALDTLIKKKLIVSTYSEKLKGKNSI